MAIFMSSLTRPRRYYKRFRKALELPDPCRSYEDYLQLKNEDLAGMDRLELRNAWNAAELALLLLGEDDRVFYIGYDGSPVTAKAWLLGRVARIRKLWRGVAG